MATWFLSELGSGPRSFAGCLNALFDVDGRNLLDPLSLASLPPSLSLVCSLRAKGPLMAIILYLSAPPYHTALRHFTSLYASPLRGLTPLYTYTSPHLFHSIPFDS